MISFNINNYAAVTLTQIGADIYNARYDDVKEYLPDDYVFQNTDVKEGFVLRAQLWTLFQDFGPHISIGMTNPFKDCTITFDEKDFEDV